MCRRLVGTQLNNVLDSLFSNKDANGIGNDGSSRGGGGGSIEGRPTQRPKSKFARAII